MGHSILLLLTTAKPVIVFAKLIGRYWQIIAICSETQFRASMYRLIRSMLIKEFSSVLLIRNTICFLMIAMMIRCLVMKPNNYPKCSLGGIYQVLINVHDCYPLTKGLWRLLCIPPKSFWLQLRSFLSLMC